MPEGLEDKILLKLYTGTVPSCGVFCGGCPNYTRCKKPCLGASKIDRCQKCRFHLCCVEKGIEHCFECEVFPCKRFKGFARPWQKYGQNFIANQLLLKEVGQEEFLARWNAKITPGDRE